MTIETFHSVAVIRTKTELIIEIEEVFATPVFNALPSFDPRDITTFVPLNYGLNEAKIGYSIQGNNNVNIYQ